LLNNNKTGEVRGTENALNGMQNIILEEMEKFKGILIATSNLVGNLDTAFERRFSLKISLETPQVEFKQKIWADRLPTFYEAEFAEIARKYDFSGGEIDNIVWKLTMREIIEGCFPTISNIEKLCQEERFSQLAYLPVGFSQ
jgi:AAA+ superfamily predicted ATPase